MGNATRVWYAFTAISPLAFVFLTTCFLFCTLTKYITPSDNSSDLAKPGVTQNFIGSF